MADDRKRFDVDDVFAPMGESGWSGSGVVGPRRHRPARDDVDVGIGFVPPLPPDPPEPVATHPDDMTEEEFYEFTGGDESVYPEAPPPTARPKKRSRPVPPGDDDMRKRR